MRRISEGDPPPFIMVGVVRQLVKARRLSVDQVALLLLQSLRASMADASDIRGTGNKNLGNIFASSSEIFRTHSTVQILVRPPLKRDEGIIRS